MTTWENSTMPDMLETVWPQAPAAEHYLGPADVVSCDDDGRKLDVRLPCDGSGRARSAANALPSADRLSPGDRVLVTGSLEGGLYVIGILNRTQQQRKTEELRLGNGARAVLSQNGDGETLRLLSEKQQLLFEYDSSTGNTRLGIPQGDLEFATENGDIRFMASDGIKLKSKGSIELSSPRVGTVAGKFELDSLETEVRGENLTCVMGRTRLVTDKLETVAGTVIDVFKNVYRSVTGLFHLRAGRSRTTVEGTMDQQAGRFSLTADEDVQVKGDKIFLG